MFVLARWQVASFFFFFFQAEDGIRDKLVTGVQTCALPIWKRRRDSTLPIPSRTTRSRASTGRAATPRRPTARWRPSSGSRRKRTPPPGDRASGDDSSGGELVPERVRKVTGGAREPGWQLARDSFAGQPPT